MAEVGRKLRERAAVLTHPVIAVGLGLVALQTAFRAWALYPSWFYNDDYRLLYEASHNPFSSEYLLRPFDSQFMPLGRFIVWLVAESGSLNWTVAATVTVGLQCLAASAMLWMLVTLFGARWGIMGPFAVYLTSAINVPATMWWAASLNQLPLQIAIPSAIGCWINYLRTRKMSWLLATIVAVSFGLLAYVKATLLILVLAYLLLAHFTQGRFVERVKVAWQQYWPSGIAFLTLAATFTTYYVTQVPSVLEEGRDVSAGQLAEVMLGSSFMSGVVGGPVTWAALNPPVAIADPTETLVRIAWVVMAGLFAITWLTRERTVRVWLLLGGYVTAAYLILLGSRAVVVGPIAGREFRYLTDVLPIAVLCLGLATMSLLGAPEGTAPRPEPLLRLPLNGHLFVPLTLLISALGLVSTVRYVNVWHGQNPGQTYMKNVASDLRSINRPTFAPQNVPETVVPGFLAPHNSTTRLLPLVGDVAFPSATERLLVLADDGHVRKALIQTGTTSEAGPIESCGWRVTSGSTTVPLESSVFNWNWWLRIGYLSSDSSPVTISVPGAEVATQVTPGVNSLFVKVEGAFDEVTVSGLDKGVTLCVDTIEVGTPVPGAAP